MQRRFFGTDGIRGPYGGLAVNEAFFASVGTAAASWLEARGVRSGKVIIGRDTRASGAVLERAIGAGFRAGSARPVSVGIVPTPAVSLAASLGRAALGAVITASHNPASDNGVKFFGPDGAKLTDVDEAAIEALLDPYGDLPEDTGELRSESALEAYIESASRILPPDSLRGWKIALDTANGATCASSPAVLRSLGAELTGLGDQPNGLNINDGVGSEHPDALAKLVLSAPTHIGIAHDGDGDRCVLCDELGQVLDGDEVLAILATDALARGTLAKNTLVVTVQSNLGLDRTVEAAGGRVIRTSVGDRYVAEAMRAEGASLGGESSGHILSLDLSPSGDGLTAALKVIRVMAETQKPLSELRKVLVRFPQLAVSLKVRAKKPIASLPGLSGAIASLEKDLGALGRVLVRYSGTEPKLRLLVEGPTEAAVRAGIERLNAAARAELDVL